MPGMEQAVLALVRGKGVWERFGPEPPVIDGANVRPSKRRSDFAKTSLSGFNHGFAAAGRVEACRREQFLPTTSHMNMLCPVRKSWSNGPRSKGKSLELVLVSGRALSSMSSEEIVASRRSAMANLQIRAKSHGTNALAARGKVMNCYLI